LVKRFGLSIEINNLNDKGCCENCNAQSPIKEPLLGISEKFNPTQFLKKQSHSHKWETSINSLHIIIGNDSKETIVKISRMPSKIIEFIKITDGLERIIISKSDSDEKYINIELDTNNNIDYLPVLDRAHFPVKELSSASNKYIN
jgi:pyruvate formate lyase activating enzyme